MSTVSAVSGKVNSDFQLLGANCLFLSVYNNKMSCKVPSQPKPLQDSMNGGVCAAVSGWKKRLGREARLCLTRRNWVFLVLSREMLKAKESGTI